MLNRKIYKSIIVVLMFLSSFLFCIMDNIIVYQCPMKCGGEMISHIAGSCPVCRMNLKPISHLDSIIETEKISGKSIFNLTSTWSTEEGKIIKLEDLKGKVLVIVMIYTTCKAACPRLVADMKNIEKQIPENYNKNLQYILVSVNPDIDTPKRLKKFAVENYIDGEEWTFLQGNKTSVREFSNVLAVKYKQISPLDFSHSNIISVFNPQGELIHQQEGLGVDSKETVSKIIEIAGNHFRPPDP